MDQMLIDSSINGIFDAIREGVGFWIVTLYPRAIDAIRW